MTAHVAYHGTGDIEGRFQNIANESAAKFNPEVMLRVLKALHPMFILCRAYRDHRRGKRQFLFGPLKSCKFLGHGFLYSLCGVHQGLAMLCSGGGKQPNLITPLLDDSL